MRGVAGQAPLTGPALGIAAIALAAGTFMQVLDSTIANVSLPTIAGNLSVSADSSTWIITSFAVANGITVPLTGWLMRRYGVVRTFVASISLFTLASLLCGIAWDLGSLIIFRVLQGAVSGPMIPGSQALLIAIFPPERRSTALGIWAMTTLAAPIMGPVLGGYISDNYHWSWIFLINVPFGIAVALVTWFSLRRFETPTARLPVDMTGLLLLAFWVGLMQITLDLGKNADWFNATYITVMTVLVVIGFFAWLIWELTDEHPIVDLSLFRHRNFLVGTLALSIGYGIFFSGALLMPLWLQQHMGYTATWAGLAAAPTGVVAIFLTPLITRYSSKIDARILSSVAFVGFGVSFLMRSYYTTSADFWALTLPSFVQGIGAALFFTAILNIALEGIPPERVPSATGVLNFARITCGSFCASLITTFWDRREALHQTRLSDMSKPGTPAFDQAMDILRETGLSMSQAAAVLDRMLVEEAYLLAVNDIFWISGWTSIGIAMIVWLARKPSPLKGPVSPE